jgi:hypothetical protein
MKFLKVFAITLLVMFMNFGSPARADVFRYGARTAGLTSAVGEFKCSRFNPYDEDAVFFEVLLQRRTPAKRLRQVDLFALRTAVVEGGQLAARFPDIPSVYPRQRLINNPQAFFTQYLETAFGRGSEATYYLALKTYERDYGYVRIRKNDSNDALPTAFCPKPSEFGNNRVPFPRPLRSTPVGVPATAPARVPVLVR